MYGDSHMDECCIRAIFMARRKARNWKEEMIQNEVERAQLDGSFCALTKDRDFILKSGMPRPKLCFLSPFALELAPLGLSAIETALFPSGAFFASSTAFLLFLSLCRSIFVSCRSGFNLPT